MAVAKTYQGYILEDGRFLVDGLPIKLASRRRAVVEVFDEAEVEVLDEAHSRQVVAVKKFLRDIAELKEEDNVMTDADWDELDSLRAETNAGFSRMVKL